MEAKDKLEQDEAIYQAGKKAGIREVVEWIENNTVYWNGAPTLCRHLWQVKLKEWGVKE